MDSASLIEAAQIALDGMGVHRQAELSLYLVDEQAISRLHEHYMGERGPTDVLAFSMDEMSAGRGDEEDEPAPMLLGDVVLCPEVARRQAREAGHPPAEELALLCIHGVLHLLGYDHAEAEDKRAMFELQDELLGKWRARSR